MTDNTPRVREGLELIAKASGADTETVARDLRSLTGRQRHIFDGMAGDFGICYAYGYLSSTVAGFLDGSCTADDVEALRRAFADLIAARRARGHSW